MEFSRLSPFYVHNKKQKFVYPFTWLQENLWKYCSYFYTEFKLMCDIAKITRIYLRERALWINLKYGEEPEMIDMIAKEWRIKLIKEGWKEDPVFSFILYSEYKIPEPFLINLFACEK